MNKKDFGLLILIVGLLLFGSNVNAADGDLIVDGQLHVTGEVSVYRYACPGSALEKALTSEPICKTTVYRRDSDWTEYFNCDGICGEASSVTCNNAYVGKLFP